MKWVKPEMKEIPLGMEVTAYVNTERPATGPAGQKAETKGSARNSASRSKG